MGAASWYPAGLGDTRDICPEVRRPHHVPEEGTICDIGPGPDSVPSWSQVLGEKRSERLTVLSVVPRKA